MSNFKSGERTHHGQIKEGNDSLSDIFVFDIVQVECTVAAILLRPWTILAIECAYICCEQDCYEAFAITAVWARYALSRV